MKENHEITENLTHSLHKNFSLSICSLFINTSFTEFNFDFIYPGWPVLIYFNINYINYLIQLIYNIYDIYIYIYSFPKTKK